MALPTGSFSSSNAGRLQVSFSGQWGSNTGDRGAGVQLYIRAYVGSGADLQTSIMAFNGGEAGFIERDYAGGNVAVPVGMEYVSHTLVGPSSVGINKCRITCVLIKR
jgi:hypothetical protein